MNDELEMFMADLVQREAPEDVAEFISAIQQDGVTQAEVDEVRQITLQTLSNPDNFPNFIQYLLAAGLMTPEDAPAEFDAGFVLSILGLVGVAQQIVTTG
jgi:hypothetical protein